MKKDWTNFGATLNQITKVQPNFVNVWLNQAWNVSYNISVEFDDYRERYRWVIKGFDFLKEGIQHNERQPRLPWELGWMMSQKIGKADEHKQFRKLFKEDEIFTVRGRWRCATTGWWEGMVRAGGRDGGDPGRADDGQRPADLPLQSAMCQMNYADDLENDGTFGEVAKRAWVPRRPVTGIGTATWTSRPRFAIHSPRINSSSG